MFFDKVSSLVEKDNLFLIYNRGIYSEFITRAFYISFIILFFFISEEILFFLRKHGAASYILTLVFLIFISFLFSKTFYCKEPVLTIGKEGIKPTSLLDKNFNKTLHWEEIEKLEIRHIDKSKGTWLDQPTFLPGKKTILMNDYIVIYLKNPIEFGPIIERIVKKIFRKEKEIKIKISVLSGPEYSILIDKLKNLPVKIELTRLFFISTGD